MEAQASLEGAAGLFVFQQKALEAGQAVLDGSVARWRADPGGRRAGHRWHHARPAAIAAPGLAIPVRRERRAQPAASGREV